MPDLLGPNQLRDHDSSVCWNSQCAEYSEAVPGCCKAHQVDGECEDRYQLSDYGKAVATALLEALKAGGVKFDNHGDPEGMSYDQFDAWLGQIHGPGHLIFIPEAQP